MTLNAKPRQATVFGCAGPALSADERAFFRDARPTGYILFARNIVDPDQVRRLCDDLRAASDDPDAPILIDQEGGRVARLGPPHWQVMPAAARLGAIADRPEHAAWLSARLIARDLHALGITVDCAPVVDLPAADGHEVIGDRAFDTEPGRVAALARAFAEGLMAGGVLPVVKHMPGHGRARVDSHTTLPVVDASAEDLAAHDFAPFAALADMPWGMTGHILFTAIDSDRPATLSPTVIRDVIRDRIGFDGVLISDDLSMKALAGGPAASAAGALAAGCDLALHCNGDMAEMIAVADACGPLTPQAQARLDRAARMLTAPASFDDTAARSELAALLEAPPATA